jgi:hypothetical protein
MPVVFSPEALGDLASIRAAVEIVRVWHGAQDRDG